MSYANETGSQLTSANAATNLTSHSVTSHSFISNLESGTHIPTIPVLQRILAVLDEDLLIGIERRIPGEESEREIAAVPGVIGA